MKSTENLKALAHGKNMTLLQRSMAISEFMQLEEDAAMNEGKLRKAFEAGRKKDDGRDAWDPYLYPVFEDYLKTLENESDTK